MCSGLLLVCVCALSLWLVVLGFGPLNVCLGFIPSVGRPGQGRLHRAALVHALQPQRVVREVNPVEAAYIEASREGLNGFHPASKSGADHFRNHGWGCRGKVGILAPRHDFRRA